MENDCDRTRAYYVCDDLDDHVAREKIRVRRSASDHEDAEDGERGNDRGDEFVHVFKSAVVIHFLGYYLLSQNRE